MIATSCVLPSVDFTTDPGVRWFSDRGCVVYHDDRVAVYVGGSLIAAYGASDRGERNVAVVGLSLDPRAHLGHIASAFDITSETLRLIRRQADAEGLGAVLARAPGGSESKVTPALRRRLEKLFAQGLSIAAAHERVARRSGIGRTTVWKVRSEWETALKASARKVEDQPTAEAEATLVLALAPVMTTEPTEPSAAASAPATTERDVGDAGTSGSDEEREETAVEEREPSGGRLVQHAGTLLMIAQVAALGVHADAERLREGRCDTTALRIAIDAVIASLALGQTCVEGVRRLATPSAGALLRADHAPSASWVRRMVGRFSRDQGGARFHLALAGTLARAAKKDEGPTVFYVDNHMRPYTGKHTVRRGWRMQDKRVRPGTTDYYVHDSDGRPVLRIDVPEHGSLTDMLLPIASLLRRALGDDERVLLAFDRAGAFPEQMAELRDAGVDFVTYERRPYPVLAASKYDRAVDLDDERVRFTQSRINLGKGRGRVQRISVLRDEKDQINLVAVSELPAEQLIAIMAGRWRQENGFKHGVERWGINQLDGRTVEPYPPDAIIPNPARRRLDRALRIARVHEGDLRNGLARLGADHPRRAHLKGDLAAVIAQQRVLEAQRPTVPTHAALADTELKDKLVRHPGEYKLTLDTIRIACANVESDMAAELAPKLAKPAEAKRVVANVLAAPARIRVGSRTIAIDLAPAGTRAELDAVRDWLRDVSDRGLTLPGDAKARRLRFRSQ
jgi:hypothetical protein